MVVVFSSAIDGKLGAVAFDSSGKATNLNVQALSSSLDITQIKCKTFKSSPDIPGCVFIHYGNTFTDVIVKYSSGSTNLSFENERQYTLYDVLKPVYLDFNEELIVMKTQYGSAETMLMYNRTEGSSTELGWGLYGEDYYNTGSNLTRSIPLVYTSKSGQALSTSIRFTQDISQQGRKRLLQATSQPIFSGFKAQELRINLSENVTVSDVSNITFVLNKQTAVGVLDIFERVEPDPPAPTPSPTSSSVTPSPTPGPTPTPPSGNDGIPWWVWVIVGVVIFAILMGLVLRYLTKPPKGSDEIDPYYSGQQEAKTPEAEE